MPEEKTSWGKFANWYDEHLEGGGSYHETLILPNLVRLLGPLRGKKILDIACGQGYFARALQSKGALVAGIDISKELISKAKDAAPGVDFRVSESHKLPFKAGAFDAVIIVLALQNIEKAKETLIEVSRMLKPKGKLILILNHPAFRVPKASDWGWDIKNQTQYRRVEKYLSESKVSIVMNPSQSDASTISFHRPFQFYGKALEKAGMAITRIEEWESNRHSHGTRAQAENRARHEIPLFLMLEAARLPFPPTRFSSP